MFEPKLGMILEDKDYRRRKIISVAHDNPSAFLLSQYLPEGEDKAGTWFTVSEAEERSYHPLPEPKEAWKPNMGDTYYRVEEKGRAARYIWSNDETDKELFSIGNCFPTEALAREAAERVKKALKDNI